MVETENVLFLHYSPHKHVCCQFCLMLVVIHLVDFGLQSSTFEAGMTASASPHFGSIPSVAGKNLPNQSHIWSRLGWERASKKAFFSGRVAYPDDRHVLIPHMLKSRKRYMASLIRDDLLGPDTSCKCLRRGHREACTASG